MEPTAEELLSLERKSPYLEQLHQREQNLRQELSRLQVQTKKLENDVQAIETERKAVDARNEEVTKQEKIADEQEKEVARNDFLQMRCEATDKSLEELRGIVGGIRSILEEVHNEIKERKLKELQGKDEPAPAPEDPEVLQEKIMSLKQEELNTRQYEAVRDSLKGKAESCDRLRLRINQLKDDLLARENDVEKIEAACLAHTSKIEETTQRRGALRAREIRNEDRKRKVEGLLAAHEEKRQKIMAQREQVRSRMAEVEKEQEHLDEIEEQLKTEEERLDEIQKRDEDVVIAAAAENEAGIRSLMQKDFDERRKGQSASHMNDRLEDFLIMWEEDPVATERTFVKMERTARMKKRSVETEQKKWLELWNMKHKQLDDMIQQLEQRINEYESMDKLKQRFEELKVVHDDLERMVSEDQDQLRVLSFGSEEECQKVLGRQLECEKERQRIYERNVELAKGMIQLKELESMIETEEPRIEVLKQELGAKMQALEIKEQASQKMFELYQKQLDSVQKRCAQLKTHLEKRMAQD